MKKVWILVLVAAVLLSFAGCRRQIAVDSQGLPHITVQMPEKVTTKRELTFTLVADPYFALPETVAVIIDGKAVTEGVSYDAATGLLVVAKEAATGDIALEGKARELLLGSFAMQADLTKTVQENSALLDPTLLQELTLPECKFQVQLTVGADGTYTMAPEKLSYEAATNLLRSRLSQALDVVIEGMLQQDKIDMDVQAFLEYTNLTYQKLLGQSYDLLLPSSALAPYSGSGTAKEADGKVTLDHLGEVPYTLEEGVLTLQTDTPLVLQRVP